MKLWATTFLSLPPFFFWQKSIPSPPTKPINQPKDHLQCSLTKHCRRKLDRHQYLSFQFSPHRHQPLTLVDQSSLQDNLLKLFSTEGFTHTFVLISPFLPIFTLRQQNTRNCQNPLTNSDKKVSSRNNPNRTMKNILITLGLLSLTSCAIPSAVPQTPPTSVPPIVAVSPTPIISKTLLRTLHIAIGLDRTGSKANNKVPDMTLAQIRTLAEGLQQRGGDLRITTICSDSDKAMLRLNFDPPIQPPTAPTSEKADNVFENAQLQEKTNTKQAQFQTVKAEFDRQQQAKTATDKAKIVSFLQQVAPLLNQPATCQASDMIGIVQRSDLFLQERQPAGSDNPRKVMFLVTDGQDTASKAQQVPELQSKAEVVVISGGQGAGIFEPLKPVKFDAIDAAIADILSR
jgi:hypothetical protein